MVIHIITEDTITIVTEIQTIPAMVGSETLTTVIRTIKEIRIIKAVAGSEIRTAPLKTEEQALVVSEVQETVTLEEWNHHQMVDSEVAQAAAKAQVLAPIQAQVQ